MCLTKCSVRTQLGTYWGRSSDGRALAQHARGTGIDTRRLHNTVFCFLLRNIEIENFSPVLKLRIFLSLQAYHQKPTKNWNASSGNRTRAARVAGEHSTTEPTMLSCDWEACLQKSYIPLTFKTCQKKREDIRSRQDSNLRSQRESDFQSDALTTRPRLHLDTCSSGRKTKSAADQERVYPLFSFLYFLIDRGRWAGVGGFNENHCINMVCKLH